MKISELIGMLANKIADEGDTELSDKLIVELDNGDLVIMEL